MSREIHYVGIATHINTGEFYVFKRKLPKDKTLETDEYYGSGVYPKSFPISYKKKFFEVEIIESFEDDENACINLEAAIISELMCDDCMNRIEKVGGKQGEPSTRYNSNPVYINNVLYKSCSYAAKKLNINKANLIRWVSEERAVIRDLDNNYLALGLVAIIGDQKELEEQYKQERFSFLKSDKRKLALSIAAPNSIKVTLNNIEYRSQSSACRELNINRSTLKRRIAEGSLQVKGVDGTIHSISY